MFEDSLLESGGRNSKLKRRGPWATLVSFAIQIALIGVLVLIPLIYTDNLPKQQLMGYLVAPPPPPPPPPPAAAPAAGQVIKASKSMIEIDNGKLKAPTAIPKKIAMVREDVAPPQVGGVVGGVPGGVPGGVVGGVPGGSQGGVIGGVLGTIASAVPVAVPVPKVATPQRVKVSGGVTTGLLIHKVQPTYPQLAKQARISGSVILQAVIGKDGSIQNLRAVSGPPMLIQSAIEAVRQWRYKPYYLNGEPVEVDTQITVNFTLAGG
ncbi:MAG: energy transducer TonB [Acidobacteria bacterium]|nr:MAG: energy transducer TonB [Acidobacteriota bacterium]